MRIFFAPIVVLALLLSGGCSKVQVSQDYRPGIDFTTYATYEWQQAGPQESTDPRVTNPLLHERFRQAVDREMVVRVIGSQQDADLKVAYTYKRMTKVETDPLSTSVGFGFGRHTRYGGVGFGSGGDVRQYDVGLLVIDIYDKEGAELLWRGSGTEVVTTHSSPEDTTAFVNRMVNSIMEQFPPVP